MKTKNATGPLRVHPRNPRYFTDGSGRAVYLTGSHTWSNLQEFESDSKFDFEAYLNFMQRYCHNFMRMWAWECGMEAEWIHGWSPVKKWVYPLPFQITQNLKFDLTRFNKEYFERLRERAIAAGKRGIYVSIMLFQGWDVETKGRNINPLDAHPFNRHNNINGIDGDPENIGEGTYIHSLKIQAITRIQETYVREVIDIVNDLDNVLYEVSNESCGESKEWQYHMINWIHHYEATKPKQHPVGMTFTWSNKDKGTNNDLFESPADWISPNPESEGGANYCYNPPQADGRKVVLLDTDHLWGLGGDVAWVWKAFLRGYNPLFMDVYDSGYAASGAIGLGLVEPGKIDLKWDPVRIAMYYTRKLAEMLNLSEMTPQSMLAQTGYCLANLGVEYLVYIPSEWPLRVWVDLSKGKGEYSVEWFNPETGVFIEAKSVSGGDKKVFTAPFKNGSILYIKQK